MFRKKIRNGGFVLVEFAIALPLLILVMYGLAIVSMKIFSLGKEQLADYVLEAEAQYVIPIIDRMINDFDFVIVVMNLNFFGDSCLAGD